MKRWTYRASFLFGIGVALQSVAAAANRSTAAQPVRTGGEAPWIRAGGNTGRPAWGLRGGLQWGLPPRTGRPTDGPRGLIRLRSPVLPDGGYDLINFIAVEPIVAGRRGFSELEPSQLDGVTGKRFWAREPAGRLERLDSGVERLTVHVAVERFQNNAHVELKIVQRSDAPDEIELIVDQLSDSAPIEYCILTATMGNKARARHLWLKDGVGSSLELYPGYRGNRFAPHRIFSLERLQRTPSGEILTAITTDEADPAAVDPAPAARHWRYRGVPVTQYWKKPADSWREDLHVAVNGRYTYWMSRHPIPGGVAFENFEMRERFHAGQRFVFGITRRKPREIGFVPTRQGLPRKRKHSTAGDVLRQLRIRDFGAVADGRTDSGNAIREAIAAAIASGPGAELVFEKGVYRIGGPKRRGYCLPVHRADRLTIRGTGNETKIVITQPAAGGFLFRLGRQVVVRDLTIDYDPLPFCQGTIRAVDPGAGQFDLEVEAGFSTPDAENFVEAVEPFGKWGMILDPATRRIRAGTPDHYMTPRWEHRKGRVWRFFTKGEHYRLGLRHMQVGDAYVHLARGYGAALLAQGCDGVRIENVVVHSSPGLAVGLVGNRGGILVRRLEVRFVAGTNRLLTTNADGVHCQQNRNGPVIEECYFEGMADDAVNIYAPPNVLREIRSPTDWLVTSGCRVLPGDRLQVLEPRTGRLRGEVKTVGVKRERRALLLSLESPLEGATAGVDHRSGDTLYNLDACGAGFRIRRNHMRGNRRYGCLLRAGGGVVEDNVFEDTTGAGVVLTNEPDWPEGPVPWGITISGNRFIRGGSCRGYADGPDGAALAVRATRLGHGRADFPVIHDIAIERNDFVDRAGAAVLVSGARNVRLKGNRISATADAERRRPGAAIVVDRSRGVEILANEISDLRPSTTAAVEIQPGTAPGDSGVRIDGLTAKLPEGRETVHDRRKEPLKARSVRGVPARDGGPEKPNILFIMSDDHTSQAISAYGGRLEKVCPTPNIDRLAQEGMLFRNCFVTNSICTPSRAAIFTGKYAHKNGVYKFTALDQSQPTLPRMMQKAGYHTALVGKYHLHSNPVGLDYWSILPGQGKYHDPEFIEMGDESTTGRVRQGKRTGYKGHSSDVITDKALDYLKNRRPKNRPFLFFCHYKAPHDTWEFAERYREFLENVEIPEPASLFDNYEGRSDALRKQLQYIGSDWGDHTNFEKETDHLEGKARKKMQYQLYMKKYLRCVRGVDDNVGRILSYLDRSGLAENTIVIYTADQGFFLGEHGLYDKRFMYEEALRMPFLVRWPGRVPPGSTSEGMILNIDFAPTILRVAGVDAHPEMQGRSFLSLLSETTPPDWRRSMYYRYYYSHFKTEPHLGVRTLAHKLIHFDRIDQWEFYDLRRDPREMKNLYHSPEQQQVIKELKAELRRLQEELGDNPRDIGDKPRVGR